jgi:predicted ATPase/transcriptional regulator with XRE-family HTH domain
MPTPSYGGFGGLLRQLRKAAGLTQAELAERAGLSVRGINDLERSVRRTPRRDTLALLSDALGLVGDERAIFEMAARGSDATQSPSRRALSARQHNLPVQPSPILGREREIEDVCRLLQRDDVRLVTLTGPGGIGKTRLSFQVAAQAIAAFPDGVWSVRLSRLTDPELVVPAIAQTFDLKDSGGAPLAEVMQRYLRDKRLLLVLDNFEHVVSAAPSIGELLMACSDVKALVTSRAALRLRGEHEYALPPLALPDQRHVSSPERLSQYAAVALFIERAQAAHAGFQVTNASASAVAEICARLDGLPLAIELAAARVKLLPPPALLTRLERRLPMLVGGARDLDERQQTMRNTLAWSYDLLDPEEQRLFRRLAVFAGGCALETAEAVCVAPDGAKPLASDLLDGLGRLVDQSLIQQREDGGEPRFGMLHVIREFALERLEASGEIEALRHAHAQHTLTLAATSPIGLRSASDAHWLARLEHEHDNLRAALGWALGRGEVDLCLRLGVGFAPFWWARGYYGEGRSWVSQVLAVEQGSVEHLELDAARAMLRAWALWWLGKFAWNQNDIASAREWAVKSLGEARACGDPALTAVALASAGSLQLEPPARDRRRGEALLAEAVALAHHSHDDEVLVRVLGDKFNAFVDTARDLADAQALAKELLDAAWRLDTITRLNVEAHVSSSFADIAQRQGDVSSANFHAKFTLRTVREHGFMVWTADCLRVLAWVADQTGNGMRSARLLGASATEAERQGIVGYLERLEQDMTQAGTRTTLGVEAWAATHAAGRALSIAEAITEALSDRDG